MPDGAGVFACSSRLRPEFCKSLRFPTASRAERDRARVGLKARTQMPFIGVLVRYLRIPVTIRINPRANLIVPPPAIRQHKRGFAQFRFRRTPRHAAPHPYGIERHDRGRDQKHAAYERVQPRVKHLRPRRRAPRRADGRGIDGDPQPRRLRRETPAAAFRKIFSHGAVNVTATNHASGTHVIHIYFAPCILTRIVVATHSAMLASNWFAMPNNGHKELMPPSGSRTPSYRKCPRASTWPRSRPLPRHPRRPRQRRAGAAGNGLVRRRRGEYNRSVLPPLATAGNR